MKVAESPNLPLTAEPTLKRALEQWMRTSANETNHPPAWLMIVCSDETTALTAGTGKVTFRVPYSIDVNEVRASLSTAQATNGAGGIFTVDVNNAGTSILSTKLTIDNTEKTSTTAATPAVVTYGSARILSDAEITVDIDQIGDGTAKGLKVYLIGVLV